MVGVGVGGEGTGVGVGTVRDVGVAVGVAVGGRRVAVAAGGVAGGPEMAVGSFWHALRTSNHSSAKLSQRRYSVAVNSNSLPKTLLNSSKLIWGGFFDSRFMFGCTWAINTS